MKSSKIAFCHDWIYHIGWAEWVFFDLIQKYDKSENISNIYTIFSDRKYININQKQYKIHTALPRWICNIFVYFTSHKIPILSQIFDYRNLMFWYPVLIYILSHKINKFDPDTVIISNSACIKNIHISNPKTQKILYLHSPLMYIRNHYEDNINKLNFPIKQLYQLATKYLRPRDLQTRKYDVIFANSNYTSEICQKIYWFQNIKILYPKITLTTNQENITSNSPYYIYIGRLVRFSKDLDTIIYMFNKLWLNLKIIWSWPDEKYLKSISWPNVEFLGYISDNLTKVQLLKWAKWLINLTMESFGIITVEWLLCGLPVFGYNKWWSIELVDDKSWILVDDKSLDNLVLQFQKFQDTNRDNIYISKRIQTIINQNNNW